MQRKYRKKPVVIEAFQMTPERRVDNQDWPEWLNRAWNAPEGQPGSLFRQNPDAPLPDLLCIQTLEGVHLVGWFDWIIRGIKGELYPCKPEIFDATYDPVPEDPPVQSIAIPLELVARLESTEEWLAHLKYEKNATTHLRLNLQDIRTILAALKGS